MNLDQYEGHAPAPWEWKPTGEVTDTGLHIKWLHISDYGWVEYVPPWEPTGLLLADAPLILQALIDERAEVNMLRERLIRAYDWAERVVNGNDSAMMDYTEYVCGGEQE